MNYDVGFTTVDDILKWFEEQASLNAPLDPLMYIEAGTKLQALAGNEKDKMIQLQYQVDKLIAIEQERLGAASKAKVSVRSNPIFRDMKLQEARVEQIEGMVQLSKHWARIRNEQLRAGT